MTCDPSIVALAPADADAAAAVHAASIEPAWHGEAFAVLLAESTVAGLGLRTGDRPDGDRPDSERQDSERLGGVALVRVAGGEAELLTIAIEPGIRRTGAGRRLLAAALSAAAHRGAGRLILEVAVDNDPAVTLYRSAGFVDIGRRRGYYARPGGAVDALLLARPLQPATLQEPALQLDATGPST